tara:strand:- start:1252 stop:4623 length:3372 start_codon:yes stop_codon:yes gene_type:complete
MLSHSQTNYLSNVLIVKVKESFRGYFHKDETSNLKLESLYKNYGVTSVSRTYPNSTKPRTETNELGIKYADISLIYTLEYEADVDPKSLIHKFMNTGVFQYVEPSFTFHPLYTPNDPEIDSLYFLDLLNLYTAWDIEKGDTNVVIGISDTGFDIDHPDLMNSVKYNYADPINGVDDDGDGYVDNFRGWDLGDNDNDPSVGADWHGIYVSSFVGATADNGIQLAGTGFNCKIVPIKIESGGALTHAYQSITYAADQGFEVVNCSWGSANSWSQQGQDIVTYATINKNCLVVAAAGNDNSNALWYPASFDWVLSVGGTNQNKEKWVQSAGEGSTYNDNVDVMAPSVDLYRVNNNGGAILGGGRGTSFAAPMASGVAGLIKSKYSGFSALQVMLQLKATSTNIDTVPNNSSYQGKLGRGLINAEKAVTDLSNPGLVFDAVTFTDNDDEYYGIGDTIYIYGNVINLLQNSSVSTRYKLTTESPYVQLLDSVVDLGAILFNTSKNTSSLRLSFIVKENMPTNENVMFKVILEDGDYYNWRVVSKVLNPDHINIEENNIKFSVGASGKLGFNGEAGSQTIGHGVKYKNGANILYQMSLLATINETQTSYVLDGDYQTNSDIDSSRNLEAEMVVYSNYNDEPAAGNKIGIEVNQKTMAWSDTDKMDFIILEMNIKNTSGSEISNLNFGIFADWDIATYSQNYAVYDSTIKTGYAYSSGGTYGGIHVISDGSINNYAFDNNGANGTISHYDGFSPSEQHTSISGGILKDSAGLGDVSNIIGLGGLSIGVDDSIKVTFALVVGDNYNTLKQAALESDTAYYELYNLATKVVLNDSLSCNKSCDGKAKVEASGGAGEISYSWYDAPSSPSGDSISELCAGTYHVQISDELELKDTLTVSIGEPDAFYVNLGNDTSICQGDSITFDAGPDYTYLWSPSGESSRQIIASSAALYSVTVTNSYSCSVSDSINLTLNTIPVINFNDTVMSNGMSCDGAVNGFVSGGTPDYIYTWSDDSERDSIHAVNLCPDVYTLTVTDQNSCVGIDSIEIENQSLVNKNSLFRNYSIYPNPTSGYVYLTGIPVYAEVFVTDILGNIVVSKLSINSFIDFSDISSGTYFVNVVIDEIRSVKKITVKK